MTKCEWHNYPAHGCDREAKIFCKSLVKKSFGITPAHRAFCKECFDRAVKMPCSEIEQVSHDEWKKLRNYE